MILWTSTTLSYFLSDEFVLASVTKPIQQTLDLRKSIFSFLNLELFDLKKIYVVNLKTGRPKKMPFVGEFAT